MKLCGVLLILLGLGGSAISMMMFGDIGLAGMIGSVAALLSGMGIFAASCKINRLNRFTDECAKYMLDKQAESERVTDA